MNPFSLEGKNAWVTGASYGIGFNIAKAFAEAGAKHIVFNARSEASLQLGLDNYIESGKGEDELAYQLRAAGFTVI